MTRVIVATNNQGKVKEFKDFLSELSFEIFSLADMGLKVQVEETEPDFAGNSLKKAREISEMTKEIVIADDSGLEVHALDGKPGVYSARFAGENASDKENNEKLLLLLKDVPEYKRKARFKCVITMYCPDGRYVQTEGICPGKIGFEPVGTEGFGYDPIFILDGHNKTMAELTIQEKNAASHRGYALQALRELLKRNSNIF